MLWKGFWSYTHDDDKSEEGRIKQLLERIQAEYEIRTGEKLVVFYDKEDILWGEELKQAIEEELNSVLFFIAIVTPRYLRSTVCRAEFNQVAQRAQELGLGSIILPIHYVDVPELSDENCLDEVAKRVKALKWEDWRELRLEDASSSAHRTGVASLVNRLITLNAVSAETKHETSDGSVARDEEMIAEESGTLDNLEGMESSFIQLTDLAESMSLRITDVGDLMNQATDEIRKIDSKGKGFSGRLAVARKLAQNLADPALEISNAGNAFSSYFYKIDLGLRTLLSLAQEEIADTPASLVKYQEFAEDIKSFIQSTQEAYSGARSMVASIEEIIGISRDLRVPLNRIRNGLIAFLETESFVIKWEELLDESEFLLVR